MADVDVQELEVPGPVVPVRVRVYRPQRPTGLGLLWVHGGGFASGDLDLPEADATARFLAARGLTTVSSHYRLAVDGVHFPAPVDDVRAAWQWAVRDAGLPVRPGGWSIGGASAGSTLAAAVALQARDGLAPVPSGVVLVYPALHGVMPEPSAELAAAVTRARRVVPLELHPQTVLSYVGSSELVTHPYAFPGHGDLTGYPPTLVVNCELDTLRTSGERFAEQLREVGVDVTVVCEPGEEHAHLNNVGSPGATHTCTVMLEWLRRAESDGRPTAGG